MDWHRALHRLENDVIKIDVMASDEAEFLATHVPFEALNVQRGGRADSGTELWSEEQMYERLVANEANQHRLVMVLGSNGAGKSHLIRWLRARFLSSGAAERQGDRVLFIRRLGNTFRGAISQLLEEGVVKNTDLEARLRTFVDSADSQDEGHFKSTIYSTFIDQVRNDPNNEPYTVAQRRDIAACLSDSRVRQHMMADGGPVARFYAQIARASGKVVSGEAGFTTEDFSFDRSLIRAVQTEGAREADRFLKELHQDNLERTQLAQYLNHFASAVLNRCANIAQGDTREVFAELRRELKKQGRSLTIFIEDFTSFRNVDSELITVLATEHGGANADLCRVTAVVGITDGYYEQFRNNFLDRVTHKVTVNEGSYGEPSFLKEFVARYLNAIYGSQGAFQTWYEQQADPSQLPLGDFVAPLTWESVEIAGKPRTLYPFNEKALVSLFPELSRRTPREMLRMLRDQVGAFIQDQIDGTARFPAPLRGKTLNWAIPEHGTHLDRVGLDERTRERARTLLCLWGSGDIYEVNSPAGTDVGGLPERFLQLLGIRFQGIAKVGDTQKPKTELNHVEPEIEVKQVLTQAQKNYVAHKQSLEKWAQNHARLDYSNVFRGHIRQFLASAINWQAEGVPAFIFRKRMETLTYIQGQTEEGSPDKAMLVLERTPDHQDILRGLLEFDYHKGWGGWGSGSATYYQLVLAQWVESVKPSLIDAMLGGQDQAWPLLRWSMAVELYRLGLSGKLTGKETETELLGLILHDDNSRPQSVHRDGTWQELNSLLSGRQPELKDNKEIIQEIKRTHMGIPTQSASVRLYHTGDLLSTLRELDRDNWSLGDALSTPVPPSLRSSKPMTVSHGLAKELATRVDDVITDEHRKSRQLLAELRALLGGASDAPTFERAGYAMVDFLTLLGNNHIAYQGVRQADAVKIHEEADDLASRCSKLEAMLVEPSRRKVITFYSQNTDAKLRDVLQLLQKIKTLAVDNSGRMQLLLAGLQPHGQTPVDVRFMQERLVRLEERIEAMGRRRQS